MGTQDWVYGLSLYFVGLFVIVSLFSIGSTITNDQITFTGVRDFAVETGQFNSTQIPETTSNIFNWGAYLSDVFSFFVWNVGYYDSSTPIILQFFWVIRILIVYLPLLALILSLYYSLPTVSG